MPFQSQVAGGGCISSYMEEKRLVSDIYMSNRGYYGKNEDPYSKRGVFLSYKLTLNLVKELPEWWVDVAGKTI